MTLFGALVALGLGALVTPAVLGAVGAEPAGLELAGATSVVVEPGDTLWSIAVVLAPEEDPRLVVDALEELNGLADATVVPGQVLRLP